MSYPYDKPLDVWADTAAFSDEAFGPASFRGPIGPLKHLEKEAREAQEAPGDVEEYADCLLLVFDAARRAGFTVYDLFDAAEAKVKKNKARQWPEWRGAGETSFARNAHLSAGSPLSCRPPCRCGGKASDSSDL